MSGVEGSHGGRHYRQSLLISLLLLFVLKQSVIILLSVINMVKSWLWWLLLNKVLSGMLWLLHPLMILSNLLRPHRPALLLSTLLHARLLSHRVHTLPMLWSIMHSINLTKALLFTLLFLNLPLNSWNLCLTTSELLLSSLLLLSLLNIHVIFDLRELLGGIRVA